MTSKGTGIVKLVVKWMRMLGRLEWGRDGQRKHAVLLASPFVLAGMLFSGYIWAAEAEHVYGAFGLSVSLFCGVFAAVWQFDRRLRGWPMVLCIAGAALGEVLCLYLWVNLIAYSSGSGLVLWGLVALFTVAWIGLALAIVDLSAGEHGTGG